MGNRGNESEAQTIQIRPGWIVQDSSHARGGIHYERHYLDTDEFGKAGLMTRHETTKTVDHVILCKKVDAVVKQVDYALRKHCARSGFGYFADNASLAKVRADVDKIRDQADEINAQARASGCARRAHIRIVPLAVSVSNDDAMHEIARHIRDSLADLRDLLRQGEIGHALSAAFLRARNLPLLTVGLQSDSLVFALQAAVAAKKEIRYAVKKEDKSPESAGRRVNLDAIEAAIELFTPSQYPPDMVDMEEVA